jgi:hypothetical protein
MNSAAESDVAGLHGGSSEARSAAPVQLIDFRNITKAWLGEVAAADEVLCVALHSTTVIIGTRKGVVSAIDPQGLQVRILVNHKDVVNSLSVDSDGRFCASGASDGRVSVLPLNAQTSSPWNCEHSSPTLAVALCPEYGAGRADSHSVCAGYEDGQLILHKRALNASRTLIHSREGPVTNVSWTGTLIAWANDRGVKVYNVATGQKVTYVPRPGASENQRCSLAWAHENRLLIGWGCAVKTAYIMRASASDTTGLLKAEVRNMEIPGLVCGVAPIGEQGLAVLTAEGPLLHLRLWSTTGEQFHVAEVPAERGQIQHLAFVSPHLPMYVVTPRALVLFQIRDFLEHALLLLDSGHRDEAVRLANLADDDHHRLRHMLCIKCVTPHLRQGQEAQGVAKTAHFDQACAAVKQFDQLEADTWKECITLFDRFDALHYFAVSIPVPPKMTLPTEVYDTVLQRLVAYPEKLVTVLHCWPHKAFSVTTLKETLRRELPPNFEEFDTNGKMFETFDVDSRSRVEALALLEESASVSQFAVRLFMGLGKNEVFKLLRRSLPASNSESELALKVAKENIQRLFEIDDVEAWQFFVERDCYKVVTVDAVVEALRDCDTRWRHEYLKYLFEKDEVAGGDYHMEMVRLYAEFEPKSLLRFLKKSHSYKSEEAIVVCRDRGLLEEEAYLLGYKVGDTSGAINIYLEKMRDVERAVNFASRYSDPELWKVLVTFVLNSQLEDPQLLVRFLECLETLETKTSSDDGNKDTTAIFQTPPNAQPASVLRHLPSHTPAHQVAGPVRRVFDSFELQESLYRSCKTLVEEEMSRAKKEFLASYRGGSAVKADTFRCMVCGRLLNEEPPELEVRGADAGSKADPGTVSPLVTSPQMSPRLPSPRTGTEPARSASDKASRPGHGIIFQGRGALHQSCLKRAPRGLPLDRTAMAVVR